MKIVVSILRTTLGALIAVLGLAVTNVIPTSAAEPRLVAGTLTCKGQGSVGFIIGSQERLDCRFNPAGSGPHHSYVASVTKYGLDIGVKGPSTLIWTVLSSTSALPRGALVGEYGGVSADASVGIGGGANALLGGSNKSITLQPLSVQGQTGVNLAVSVTGLTLRRG